MKNEWKIIDEAVKRGLLEDKNLHNFLQPVFNSRSGRAVFIRKCLRKISTRRMLLRAQWCTEIADDQGKIRQGRPALRIIFLLGLAEALAKKRMGNRSLQSFKAIKEFFRYISASDRNILCTSFKRTLLRPRQPTLRFTSILRMLYDIRNRAVHGDDFFSFSLMDEDTKKEQAPYSSFGLITSGYLGSRYRKKRVSLDIKLSYEELRDIFRRTAIANIESLL